MKQLKYVLVGALMLGINAPVMAQEDNKSVIESITKVIKSNSSDAEEQVKAVFKKNKIVYKYFIIRFHMPLLKCLSKYFIIYYRVFICAKRATLFK